MPNRRSTETGPGQPSPVIVTPPLRSPSCPARTTPAERHEKCVFAWHGNASDGGAVEHSEGRGGCDQTEATEGFAMSWIDQLIRHLEQVTCSGCGEYYHGGDIAAVVTEPSRLIVRLRCRSCGQDGIAILDFGTNPVEVDPITADDVLDCHDLLARAVSPPSELFPALAA